MIDNLPYYTLDMKSIKNAYSNMSLEFFSNEERVNKETGELYEIHKRRYLNLTFIFQLDSNSNLKKLTVRGSIHTLFNDGLHNANNFTFDEFKTTLDKFSKEFGIDLTRCVLLPPENGLNLPLNEFSEFNSEEILLNTICEQRKMFQENVPGITTSKISGTYKSEYRIKIYAKSTQYPEYCENTLRIEIQQKKMRDLHKRNIIHVSDLLDISNQIYLFEKYMKYIEKLVIFDYKIQAPNRSKYSSKILNFKDSNYWRKLIKDCKERVVHYSKYNEKLVLLNFLSNKYGNDLLQKLLQQIEEQYLNNLGVCHFSPYQVLQKPMYARVLKPMYAQLYNTCMPCNLNNGIITNRQLDQIIKKRKCLITDLDISMQKEDSFLLSHSGLRFYSKTDKQIFDKIKEKYLSKKWVFAEYEEQIKEIAHNIRNTNSNRGIKQSRLYQPHQKQLFKIAI